jgi:hypothetical protein
MEKEINAIIQRLLDRFTETEFNQNQIILTETTRNSLISIREFFQREDIQLLLDEFFTADLDAFENISNRFNNIDRLIDQEEFNDFRREFFNIIDNINVNFQRFIQDANENDANL